MARGTGGEARVDGGGARALARERGRVAEAVCAAASENVTLILRRYESGVSSILDVTDSQMKLTQAEETRLQAWADVWLYHVRLRQAVGLPVWE